MFARWRKGVAKPGNITEEEKYMEQKFVAYQVQNLKLWSFFLLLFLYLILELTSFFEDDVYSCLKLLFLNSRRMWKNSSLRCLLALAILCLRSLMYSQEIGKFIAM